MALTPSELTAMTEDVELPFEPSFTYGFNPITGEFTNKMVDHEEALRQFVIKALVTRRFTHACYNHEYGSELYSLIGEDVTKDYLENEIPRIVKDTLIYDERISDVRDVAIERIGDEVTITLTVVAADGFTFTEEVSLQ